jgi:glycosyltransferase involved in cell wall biosynthesis
VAGWAEVVGGLLDDPGRRTVLSRRGFERVRRFDWPASAEALASIYRESR